MKQEYGFSQAALGGMFWVYLVSAGIFGWRIGLNDWHWIPYIGACIYVAYIFVKYTSKPAEGWDPRSAN